MGKTVIMNFAFETHQRAQDGLFTNNPESRDGYVAAIHFQSTEEASKFIYSMTETIKTMIEEQNANKDGR